ncbi:MAG: ABC transporter ATP-binding protein, partial [Dehalococcoidia bacterium]
MSEAAILVRGLTKRYRNGTTANNGIDLTVERGTIMSVLGHNGAGKTTMIRQITGELSPTSGSITVLGRDVIQHPLEAKALMGVVPQDGELYPVLKPAEQIVHFGRLHGMSKDDACVRAEELMVQLDLQPHRDKLNKHLSGGLQRKVLIATALIANPEILVLDEPTTGLDPHSRREVWAMLRALRRDGKTLLITTHYMDEAEALSDVITMVASGSILAQGSLEELRALCGHRYKATFEDEVGEQRTVYGIDQDSVIREMERVQTSEFSL